jgi:hypothetical protein
VKGTGAWEVLGLDDAAFAAYAAAALGRDERLLFSCAKLDYLGVSYDYTTPEQLPELVRRLDRATRAGLMVVLDLAFDGEGHEASSFARLPAVLAACRGHLAAVLTCWELAVDGREAAWSYEGHLALLQYLHTYHPDLAIFLELLSPEERTEITVWDGRGRLPPEDYWTKTPAQYVDVIGLELPYSIIDDPQRAAAETGGAVCRLQGLFPIPQAWPDGTEIPQAVRDNWRTDWGIHKPTMLMEYAAFKEWSAARKRRLREWIQAVVPIAGYGEG